MTDNHRRVCFKATFPAIQTAIKVTGDGSGMRIQLDIPETEVANALGLMVMRESVLEITIVDMGKTPLKGKTERTGIDGILDMMQNDD